MSATLETGDDRRYDSPGWVGSGQARAVNASLALYILLLATLAVVKVLIAVRSLVRSARSLGLISPKTMEQTVVPVRQSPVAPGPVRRRTRLRVNRPAPTPLDVGKASKSVTAV